MELCRSVAVTVMALGLGLITCTPNLVELAPPGM
jgi:hypothetical protein